jgi:hypothetical protein
VRRWPVILTGVIDHLHNHNHALELRAQAAAPDSDEPRLRAEIADGTGIIERLSRLKYEMGRDRLLACVPPRPCTGTRGADRAGAGRSRTTASRTSSCTTPSLHG